MRTNIISIPSAIHGADCTKGFVALPILSRFRDACLLIYFRAYASMAKRGAGILSNRFG